MRRRAAAGVQVQANYTYGKTLTDSSGTLVRFDPFLDINSPEIERARADFDLNHVFNANFVWPLPLGKDGRWDYAPLSSAPQRLDDCIGGFLAVRCAVVDPVGAGNDQSGNSVFGEHCSHLADQTGTR